MSRRGLRGPAREDGFTLTELMVGVTISLGVFLALYTMLDVASSNSARVVARIEANKLARPVMADIVDKLHSTCVAPAVAPVLAGSTDRSISFVHQIGSTVAPTPVKRTIAFNETARTLTETVYNVSSGTAPPWTYSTVPAESPRLLLTPVQKAKLGSPSVEVPVFRYYAFGSNGQISTTPLQATTAFPLNLEDAARTVQVNVSFAVPPRDTGDADPDGTESLSDTVILRFSPPGESASAENLPCA